MSAPWEILGVTPGCTLQEVKRAYARLLKLHRPDRDPEGFRHVRDAYEWMRHHVSLPENLPSPSPPPPESACEPAGLPADASNPPPEAVSQSAAEGQISQSLQPVASVAASPRKRTLLQKLARSLKKARRTGNHELRLKATRRLLKSWRAKRTHGDSWDRILLEEIQCHPGDVVPWLDPADAIRDLERGGGAIASALLKIHAQRGEWEALQELLDEMQKRMEQNPTPEAVSAVLCGARYLALINWQHSQKLLNAAYPHLSEWSRDVDLSRLDQFIQTGKEIASLTPRDRSTLAQCIANESADADDSSVKLAMRNLSLMSTARIARTTLAEQFPAFEPRLRIKSSVLQPKKIHVNKSSDMGWRWIIFLVIFTLVRVVTSCFSTTASKRAPATIPKRDQHYIEIHKQHKEDHLQKLLEDLNDRGIKIDHGQQPNPRSD